MEDGGRMRHGSEGAPLPAPSPQWHWWHAVWTSGKICHRNSPVAIVARFSHLIITLNALPPKRLHWRPSRERERERECVCVCERQREREKEREREKGREGGRPVDV